MRRVVVLGLLTALSPVVHLAQAAPPPPHAGPPTTAPAAPTTPAAPAAPAADPDDEPVLEGPAAPDAVRAGAPLRADGDALGKAGKYELALARFREAARRFPSATHDCFVGLTYFRLGRLTAARLYVDVAPSRGDEVPSWCSGRLVGELERELARRGYQPVTITIDPADAIVGTDEIHARGGRVLWLPPGHVAVTARRDGYQRARTELDVPTTAPARPLTLAVVMHVRTPDAPAIAAAPPPSRWPPRRVGGYALVVGGGALVTAGAVFHVAALASKSDGEALYRGDPRFATVDARFDRQRAYAIAGYAAGAAAIGAGVYLLVRGRAHERDPRAVDVAIDRERAVVSMTWTVGGW